MTEYLPWLGVLSSMLSAAAVVWLARQSVTTIKGSRLELAAPTLPPEAHRQPVRAADETWRQWVSEGYDIAEAAAARSLKENSTKPDPADKRATAISWVRENAEKYGLEWQDAQAAFAAKLLELHHHRQKPKRTVDTSANVVPNSPR